MQYTPQYLLLKYAWSDPRKAPVSDLASAFCFLFLFSFDFTLRTVSLLLRKMHTLFAFLLGSGAVTSSAHASAMVGAIGTLTALRGSGPADTVGITAFYPMGEWDPSLALLIFRLSIFIVLVIAVCACLCCMMPGGAPGGAASSRYQPPAWGPEMEDMGSRPFAVDGR